MNINDVKYLYARARAERDAGNYLEAARMYWAAQRDAARCSSARRVIYWDLAHTGACLAAARVLAESSDHAERSEAGRIRSESAASYRAGLPRLTEAEVERARVNGWYSL